MAVEKPTWIYKSEGDWQTASEMNQLAQAVITNATELSNAKDDVANLSNDVTDFNNRLTAIEESNVKDFTGKDGVIAYPAMFLNPLTGRLTLQIPTNNYENRFAVRNGHLMLIQ